MKTYDVFLCHSTRHDADTATENTMAMVYVLLRDQLGSRPRGQARRGGDPRRVRPGPPARARDRHAPELRGRTAAARAGRQVAPAEGISWASPITPAWSPSGERCLTGQSVLTTAIEEGPRTSPHARWQLRRNIVRSQARTSVIWEAEHLRQQGSVKQPLTDQAFAAEVNKRRAEFAQWRFATLKSRLQPAGSSELETH